MYIQFTYIDIIVFIILISSINLTIYPLVHGFLEVCCLTVFEYVIIFYVS